MALSLPNSSLNFSSQLDESDNIVSSEASPVPSDYTESPSLVHAPSPEPTIREPEKGKMKSPPPSAIADPHGLDGSSASASASASSAPAPAPASASSSKGKQAVIITKDEEYFMESAFMVFQVERCLFRVPSYLFSKESHVFGGMFRLPQPYPHHSENGEAEGSSEANPIILPDEFTKVDFRCLLKALYPLSFTLRLTLSKEEWLSILNLSTKWYFLNLRSTAISELESLDTTPHALTSLENITHGRKHRISSWLLSGLVDLVMRDQTIDDDLALSIDGDYPTTAYRLFRTRELRFRGFLTSRQLGIKEIEVLFSDELAQVRFDEKAYEALEVEIELENPEPGIPETSVYQEETHTEFYDPYPVLENPQEDTTIFEANSNLLDIAPAPAALDYSLDEPIQASPSPVRSSKKKKKGSSIPYASRDTVWG